MTTRLAAFPYFGGKFIHLPWLLPLLPESKIYVELFGGSASVLLNRPKSSLEVYNDLNGDVVNFFRVLRDHPEELVLKLELTPHSFEEWVNCHSWQQGETEIEKARKFFVRATQTFSGRIGKFKASQWSRENRVNHSRAETTINKVEGLWDVAQRIREAQIENSGFQEIIRFYDSPETLFYADPPYMLDNKGITQDPKEYSGLKFGFPEHAELANLLRGIKGKVAISGYEQYVSSAYWGFKMIRAKRRVTPAGTLAGKEALSKQECLWVNYEIDPAILAELREKGLVE